MDIIIVGAGGVGFNLAQNLCVGHNVTIIDKDSEALHKIEESLDVLILNGDAEEIETYHRLINKKFDLFIGVTNSDNVNIVSTLIADIILDIDRIFIRLKNHFYPKSLLKKKLNIEKIIFPIQLTSNSIVSMLENPRFNNVKNFKYTPYKLISIRASSQISPIKIASDKFSIVGIEREKFFFIPKDEDVIIANDLVYIFTLEENIISVCNKLNLENHSQSKNCVISGGNKLGISIAKALIERDKNVKIMEKNLSLCKEVNEALGGKASVIHTAYETSSLVEDEGIEQADIFISATENDEYNIIKALEAKKRGTDKVISILDDMDYYNLLHSLDILVARGTKMSAYNTIMEHINSNSLVIQKIFCGGKAMVLMRKIFANSKLLNKKLSPLKSDHSLLFYIRKDKLIPFLKSITIEESDIIILFVTENHENELGWIYGL